MNINVSAIFVGVLSAIIFLGVIKKLEPQNVIKPKTQNTCVAVITDKYGYIHEIIGHIKGEL
jgi:hypothetical protein